MIGRISIKGEIGTAVTVDSVLNQIDPKATSYEVEISSGGGEVWTGYQIYNELKKLRKPITVIINGICASIATLIAAAGDKIKMYDVSQFMIHDPSVSLEGGASDLRSGADALDQIKSTLVTVYSKKTKLGRDEISMDMSNETFMTPEMALSKGYIDEIIPAGQLPQDLIDSLKNFKAVAYLDIKNFQMKDEKEVKGLIAALGTRITNVMKMFRFKNVINAALSDGTPIIVMTEDENWEAKQVTYEDGSPLAAGSYTTAEGVSFVVDDNSVITSVTAAPEDTTMKKEEELQKQVDELKAQLAAKDGEKTAALDAEKQANAKVIASFENKMKDFEKQFEAIKNLTVGDTTDPDKGKLDNPAPDKNFKDPMAKLGAAFIQDRNLKVRQQ